MTNITNLIRRVSNAIRQPKRRHYEPPQVKIEIEPHYRAECVGGEWWVLASDGVRLLSYGLDGDRCKEAARTLNRNVANARHIRAHVKKHFTHVPFVQ